ncbi:hypothetical protein AB1N83_009547 [Pleurotus pulmonarius]
MPEHIVTFPRAAVSDIPPEVLSRIFLILAKDGGEGATGYSLDWISVTHVCKFWNQVARNNPILWSSIDFSHPRWAEEKLSRSKSVPLSINYHHDDIKGRVDGSHEALLSKALNRLPLIRTVNIEGPVSILQGLVEKMHSLPAPLIENLYLVGTNHEDVDNTLHGNFLNGIAPRLRHAIFMGFSIDLSTSLFGGVQTLVLGPMKQLASIPDTLVLLSNLPKLVELKIAFGFRRPDGADVSRLASMDSVVMHNCRLMQVIGAEMASQEALAPSSMFLQWVRFTQPVGLEVVLFCGDSIEDTIFESCEETFGPLRNQFSAKGVRFVELNMVHSVRPERADLEFYARSEDKSYVMFSLWFRNEAPMDICGQIAFEFATRLPRDDLKLVDIASVDMNELAWCSLFGQLKRLEEIRAFLYEGLLYALYEDEEAHEGRPTFPSLSKLTLYYDDEYEEKSNKNCWEGLPEALKFRAGCGMPVGNIAILPHGPFPDEYLACLPEGLVTVE